MEVVFIAKNAVGIHNRMKASSNELIIKSCE